MAYFNKYVTSLYGRRFGLQRLTTGISGISKAAEFLVGPEALRMGTSTADTTAANLAAYGVHVISSAVSSGVFTIDPPVPGVEVTIVFQTTAATNYIKTANGETFLSSQGSTFSVLKSTQNIVGSVKLTPISTAVWGVPPGLSTASFVLSTTT